MKKETKWSVDYAHTEIAFKVRHLMITHIRGTFKDFDANIYTTAKDFSTAEIDVWINAASITTGDSKRDEHLKSADFLDVENHRQITFTSTTIGKPDEEGNHELWGDLTMNGNTKKIKLNVTFGGMASDGLGNEKAGFTVTGRINRSDWGVNWNAVMETGGLMLSDEVNIMCEIELVNEVNNDLKMELENAFSKDGEE